MNGPDHIWIAPAWAETFRKPDAITVECEYIRRDPAVLAALPEVQALIAAAYEAAAQTVASQGDCSATEALGQRICCSGHMCGCQGATVEDWLLHLIRAITSADATAALARIEREAEARGRVKGMREAAGIAEGVTPYKRVRGDAGYSDLMCARSDGTWQNRKELQAAILARADQIERDGGA